MRTIVPILVLALAWGIAPAVPALLEGQLLGHGLTDLYPSVWGMWAFADAQPGLPNHTDWIGFPSGMGYYYSSPVKGWIAAAILPFLGLIGTWNFLLIAARIGTVFCAWGAARAWGLGERGSLVAAAVYGCSPFFHGYAVEGIAEGTDGWTLALWLWAVGAKRFRTAALPFALTIMSSWYLGMVACLLLPMASLRERRVWWSGLGLLIIAPALIQFIGAFPGTAPIADAVRQEMGASLRIPTPGIHEGLYPFAINTYVGFTILITALMSRTRWVIAAAVPALLSFGMGPIYDLPIAELVRFPYRWHAGTLLLLAPAVAITANRHRWGALLAPLIVIEGLCLSPIEPWIPGASADIPAHVQAIDGPVLALPGPFSMAPGQVNRSRARARYLMYHQTHHRQPSPWVPDFNSVGVGTTPTQTLLTQFTTLDPLAQMPVPTALPFQELADLGVTNVELHPRQLGARRTQAATELLTKAGWESVYEDTNAHIYRASSQPQ